MQCTSGHGSAGQVMQLTWFAETLAVAVVGLNMHMYAVMHTNNWFMQHLIRGG